MTNSTIALIQRHGSTRKYKSDPVAPGLIDQIVLASQRASTSSNLQVVSVVMVTDPGARAQLSEICGKQEHVARAPVVLVWCADLARLERVCRLRGYAQVTNYVENFLICVLDVGIAAQNGALAAESLGLGICYLGSIRNNTQAVIDLLQLPRLVMPVVGMTVGYPAASPAVRPRLATSAILSRETYAPATHAELHTYDRAMIETGIYQGRQVPVPGKTGEMEHYGWLEHSARRASQPHRTDLREVLKRQGYALE
ncbi:MAG: NADPH-dependent oxidoreductase [candidate division NC10 bacterium]|nr:NADPH-dependent oxidoreductase [candidate division NC10 bacterium]